MHFSPVVPWIAWRSDKSVVSAVEHMAVWNSEEDWRDGLAECPSIYTNGQEVGKTCQRKNTRTISKNIVGYVFFLPRRDETPGAFKKKFGRERPGEHVWAAKPHKHRGRSRPNQPFRPRSFCRANFRSALFNRTLRRRLGEPNAYLYG
jgi:hypothetical protein